MLPQQPLFNPTFLNLEYLFYQVLRFFRSVFDFFANLDFSQFVSLLKILLTLAAILFITVIIYVYIRINELKQKEKEKLHTFIAPASPPKRNDRWEKILLDLQSANPSDWRLAIIEADSILDDMVKSMGYDGADMGERMKKIEPADFNTLDLAWEAHKVRNRIAHDGSAYPINHDEAKRIIGLYEKVFREFEYI